MEKRQGEEKKKEVQGTWYDLRLETEEVAKHNTLMVGIVSSKGEELGFVQEDRLCLCRDGTFRMEKELKTTKEHPMLREPVSVKYRFEGRYEKAEKENEVVLGPAEKGEGSVFWSAFADFLDTGDGIFDSETSPGILSFYPTAFFVERCKNVSMRAYLDEDTHRFRLEEFEPVVLSEEAAGRICPRGQAGQSGDDLTGGGVGDVRQSIRGGDAGDGRQGCQAEGGLMVERIPVDNSVLSIKERFAEWGMKAGTCINPAYLKAPYEDILRKQFDSVTLENHLKPDHTLDPDASRADGRLTVTFSDETRELLDWCKDNGMQVRAHTLIWYMGTPEWIFHENFAEEGPNVGREELLERMEDYIRGFFEALAAGGWSDLVYCIDVVNEAVIAPGTLRSFPWKDIIGEDYLWYAYHYARKYAPKHIRLCYNDFDLETKTDRVIELVNSLKEPDGTPLVDIVGQQGHYGAYSNLDVLPRALERIYRETGREIQVTELDVSVSKKGTQRELKLQGQFYYRFVQGLRTLREKGVPVTGLTFWGFADALSWMPAGHLHLYDRNLVPKYAYYGVLGMKEYAGFDLKEPEGTASGQGPEKNGKEKFVEMTFALPEGTGSMELHRDGTYTDTVSGAKRRGTYRADEDGCFMLTPEAGGYLKLELSDDGRTAERVEAAGARTRLVTKTPQSCTSPDIPSASSDMLS